MELGFGGGGLLAGDVAPGALDSIRDGEQGNCPIDDGCVCLHFIRVYPSLCHLRFPLNGCSGVQIGIVFVGVRRGCQSVALSAFLQYSQPTIFWVRSEAFRAKGGL